MQYLLGKINNRADAERKMEGNSYISSYINAQVIIIYRKGMRKG